jgi:hypothetical protein
MRLRTPVSIRNRIAARDRRSQGVPRNPYRARSHLSRFDVLQCDAGRHCQARMLAIFAHSKLKQPHPSARLCEQIWLHTAGVEFMNKLVEIRNQEFICRERALLDSERKIFWLAQAKQWEQRALDEIAFHFRERNLDRADSPTATN